MIEFTVPGKAEPGGSKMPAQTRNGRLYVRDDNRNVAEWRRAVAFQAHAVAPAGLLEGPLRLHLRFIVVRPRGHWGTGRNAGRIRNGAPAFPTVRPDLTKLERAVEDALTGIVWHDDAQIVEKASAKIYAGPGEGARLEVAIEPVPFGVADPALAQLGLPDFVPRSVPSSRSIPRSSSSS